MHEGSRNVNNGNHLTNVVEDIGFGYGDARMWWGGGMATRHGWGDRVFEGGEMG